MRRTTLLLACATLAAPLPAQAPSGIYGQAPDAWQQVMERRVQAGSTSVVQAFQLFSPKAMDGPWGGQDDFLRLRVSGELAFPTLDGPEEKALREHMGWGPEPRWVLVSPKREILGSGSEAPTSAAIRKLMEDAGWRSRWDLRLDFLRQNPSSGDAWSEELRDQALFAARKAMFSLTSGKEAADPTAEEARWGPIAKALGGFTDVEEWTGWSRLGAATLALRFGSAKISDALQAEFEKLRRGTESALRHRPSSESLWTAWSAASATGDAVDPDALVASLEPAPRQPWPPLAAADALSGAYVVREDWAGLERLASQAMDRALAPQMMAGKNVRRFREGVLEAWAAPRVLALLRLHRPEDAIAVASQARALAGPAWKELSAHIRVAALVAVETDGAAASDGKPRDAEIPTALEEFLKRDPAPDPPAPPLPPPLTLALIGDPAWAPAFKRLKDAPALDPWEPGEELAFGAVDATQAQRLRGRFGWGMEAHWVLLRGEEALDSGAELPDSKGLADRLRVQGLPFLEQLNAFLRRHPDQEEARQARLDELLSRMPNPRLEATLLEDARNLRAPFLDGSAKDWKPMKELWEPAALRLLPGLEAGLRSWPEEERRWLAYADWSSLHPRRPSPADLLAILPIWKTRARGGAGPLPDEVGASVAMRLREQERWGDLAAWGRAFWDGGLRQQLREDLGSGRKPAALAARWFILEKRLIQPFLEALSHLEKRAELRALEQELKDLGPALALRRKQVPKEGN